LNSQNNPANFLPVVITAALEAGDAALAVYEGAFDVTEKADHSPLTLADMRSHEIISAALKPSQIPVLSEEGRDVPYEERRRWPALWIVDPLDGTKEFVKKNGEFTINIALVADNRPVMGHLRARNRHALFCGRPTGRVFRQPNRHAPRLARRLARQLERQPASAYIRREETAP